MLNEKKLSKAELAKREELIQSMKKNKRTLVRKYGQDAEKVMYGRATNLAKKLAETDMEKDKLREMVKAALMQTEKKEFPDLTGDGKVTKADILKGRGVDLKEEEQLDEMAKIAGDLKAAIEKVIEKNKDAEKKDVRKAIKADDEVTAALGDESLFDNQLNKFIDLVRGEREVGQRGRKASGEKKEKVAGKRGRPKSTVKVDVKKKDDKVKTFSIGGDKKYYADDEDGPSDAELRKLARSGGKFDKSKLSQLRQQEKTKMIRTWLKDMRDKGIVDDANRILDKDAYAREWANAKVDIEARVKAINEAPLINEGEDKTWALYVKSLVNDIRLNGLKDYVDYSEDDFIIDKENYIGDRMDIDEDIDLGHQDNEPHMLKADLYRIGKYAMELYQMVDEFEGEMEVDFPHWWQAKVITAKNNLVGAKHYLDFETKEPEIDAAVDAIDMSGTLDNIGVEDEPEMEPQVMTVDLVGDEDEIEEGLPKGYWDKKIKAKDEVSELLDDTPQSVVAKANNKITDTSTMAKALLDIYNDFKENESANFESNSNFAQALELLSKVAQPQTDKESGVTEDYDALVKKIKGQGKSEKAAKAIAGAVASYKAKGGGKGPTAKQKARG